MDLAMSCNGIMDCGWLFSPVSEAASNLSEPRFFPSDQVGSSGTGAPSGLIRLISTIRLIQSTAMIGTISNQIDSQLSDISSLCTH
jgi:hypothetical protein